MFHLSDGAIWENLHEHLTEIAFPENPPKDFTTEELDPGFEVKELGVGVT